MVLCLINLSVFAFKLKVIEKKSDVIRMKVPIMLYCAAFNLGFNVVPWLMIGEIFSIEVSLDIFYVYIRFV